MKSLSVVSETSPWKEFNRAENGSGAKYGLPNDSCERRWYAERNGDVTTAIVVTFIAEPKVQGAERTESKDYVLAYFFELHAGKFHRELRTRKRRDLMPVNISGNLKRSSLHE
ncbi:hypothetical protein HZH68_004697 [Vespula germanica]|uniref:Uncharacterized protein n=1 Tax=Vespula germanica TaxID=30212 RepID=A0A834KP23_VESGE|nr:hypothetical protein HZH68_004697 [Vespula germanica]